MNHSRTSAFKAVKSANNSPQRSRTSGPGGGGSNLKTTLPSTSAVVERSEKKPWQKGGPVDPVYGDPWWTRLLRDTIRASKNSAGGGGSTAVASATAKEGEKKSAVETSAAKAAPPPAGTRISLRKSGTRRPLDLPKLPAKEEPTAAATHRHSGQHSGHNDSDAPVKQKRPRLWVKKKSSYTSFEIGSGAGEGGGVGQQPQQPQQLAVLRGPITTGRITGGSISQVVGKLPLQPRVQSPNVTYSTNGAGNQQQQPPVLYGVQLPRLYDIDFEDQELNDRTTATTRRWLAPPSAEVHRVAETSGRGSEPAAEGAQDDEDEDETESSEEEEDEESSGTGSTDSSEEESRTYLRQFVYSSDHDEAEATFLPTTSRRRRP